MGSCFPGHCYPMPRVVSICLLFGPPLASFWRHHRGWNDFMSMTFGSPLAPLGFLWPKWIPERCNIRWPSAPFALFGILLEWTEYNAIYITNWGTKYATLGILGLCCSIHSRLCEVIMRCVLWGGCGGLVRMQFLGGFKLCCTSRKVFAIVHKGDFSACFKRLLDWSLFVLWSLVQAIFTYFKTTRHTKRPTDM